MCMNKDNCYWVLVRGDNSMCGFKDFVIESYMGGGGTRWVFISSLPLFAILVVIFLSR